MQKQKFAHFIENWMACCAFAISSRILKLYQKLLHNIPYWNWEEVLDTSVVEKMTVSLKPLKTTHNGQFWEFDEFFGGQKNCLGQKWEYDLIYLPYSINNHYREFIRI